MAAVTAPPAAVAALLGSGRRAKRRPCVLACLLRRHDSWWHQEAAKAGAIHGSFPGVEQRPDIVSSNPHNQRLGNVLLWKAARYWREPPAYIFIFSVVLCGSPPEAVHMQQQFSPVSTPLLNKMTRGGRRPSTSSLSPEEQAELKMARNTASKRASRAREAAER